MIFKEGIYSPLIFPTEGLLTNQLLPAALTRASLGQCLAVITEMCAHIGVVTTA